EKELVDVISRVCEEEHYLFEWNHHEGMIYICPCGVVEVQIENYYAILKSNTALVGPGFHVALCYLFKKIQSVSKVYLSMDDECEYLEDENFERIKEVYFYPYMKALMDRFSKMNDHDEATYAWDNRSYLPLAKEKRVITPFGYIHADECQCLDVVKASQCYYIWNEIEKDAYFYRNSALVSLWCDCLFENSIYDEKALSLSKSICDALEIAHQKDASLALPVDEYQMLCKLLNRPIKIFDVEQYPNENVGYRKENVFYVYGNWFIYFEGKALQSFDDHTMILETKEEHSTPISMKITGYKNKEKMDFYYRYLNRVNSLDNIDYQNENIHIKGVLHELNDDTHTLYLQAQCISGNEMLMINVECDDMTSYQQVLQTIENIQMIPTESKEMDVKI
ncbi:MAG: hypothetical protein ACI4U3_09100, partial [Traorella sp.]